MKLTAENVSNTIKDCLFKGGETHINPVIAEGFMMKFGFNPDRLKSHEQDIIDMLTDLPIEFQRTGGGGMSFLNACMTKDGQQWGEHSNIDELVCLGMAIGKASFPLPRDMWAVLPGAMPYIVVN